MMLLPYSNLHKRLIPEEQDMVSVERVDQYTPVVVSQRSGDIDPGDFRTDCRC